MQLQQWLKFAKCLLWEMIWHKTGPNSFQENLILYFDIWVCFLILAKTEDQNEHASLLVQVKSS